MGPWKSALIPAKHPTRRHMSLGSSAPASWWATASWLLTVTRRAAPVAAPIPQEQQVCPDHAPLVRIVPRLGKRGDRGDRAGGRLAAERAGEGEVGEVEMPPSSATIR